ncbi:MAG: hypothetical protein ABIC04_03600 [Nanoarchaeota archaeon]
MMIMLKYLTRLVSIRLVEMMEYLILQNFCISLFIATKINPDLFDDVSRRKALWLFKIAANKVPAYKDFLGKNHINPNSIRGISDFDNKVPEMTKDNYIKKYDIEEICIDGKFPRFGNIDESAGSSGQPTNWIRNLREERFLSKLLRFDFDYDYEGNKKDFIVLSAWASGPWATGVKFCELMQNYSLVKNTDANINNIISTLKKFGSSYNYLIAGYPPFLKRLFDFDDINWRKYNIHIATGGEGFIPEWRKYIQSKIGEKSKIISAYGSSDLDIGIAVETPFSIFIRQLLVNNIQLREALCGHKDKIPMIFQYDPLQHYIRQVKAHRKDGTEINEIQVTMLNPRAECPKVKYNIHDEGSVIGFKDMLCYLETHEPDYKTKFDGKPGRILRFPFLLIVGRSDGTISLDGANVYPNNIEVSLHSNEKLYKITNHFKISAYIDKNKNTKFIVYIELKEGVKPSTKLANLYSRTIFIKLLQINSDYRRSYRDNNSLQPIIKLSGYDEKPFKHKSPIKNKYII